MDTVLQIWGGGFYLVAKILLALAGDSDKKLNSYGWKIFILGVPAWVIVLVQNQNWIAAALEAGGVPAMIFALLKHKPEWMEKTIQWFVGILIGTGIIYSAYQFHGIHTLSQILELGTTAGFLIGTYLLAKKNPNGWLWFMLMHICMGTLMAIESKYIMAGLQAVSFGIVVYGFVKAKSKIHFKKSLQEGRWDLENRNPMNHVFKYLNPTFVKPKKVGCVADFGIMNDCKFEFTIWHNMPCMGESGPNPGNGTPLCLKQLKGDENYFSLDLFSIDSDWQTYDMDKENGYADEFICRINLSRENFTMNECSIGDFYLYSCAIPFIFEFESKKCPGTIVIQFEHGGAFRGKCTLWFQGLV